MNKKETIKIVEKLNNKRSANYGRWIIDEYPLREEFMIITIDNDFYYLDGNIYVNDGTP